jgi:DNA uptake protein ComE-like DNA-binding protein
LHHKKGQIDVTHRFTGPNATFGHLKRSFLTISLAGILGISLAACDQGNPAPPTPTSQPAAQATATPLALIATPIPDEATDPPTPTPVEESIASPTPPIVGEATLESTDQPVSCALLNLNTVTESELMATIPGFSARMVREFFEYRPYVSIQQFRREIGKYVDDKEVARLEQYVFVPINLNTASDADILTIPGMGQRMLGEFKEYRPYKAMAQFRREIGKYVDDKEVARLERYVTIN